MPSSNPGEPEEIWEPLETVPLDGTPVRVRRDDVVATASWSRKMSAWVFGIATEPNLPAALASNVVGTCSWGVGIDSAGRKRMALLDEGWSTEQAQALLDKLMLREGIPDWKPEHLADFKWCLAKGRDKNKTESQIEFISPTTYATPTKRLAWS